MSVLRKSLLRPPAPGPKYRFTETDDPDGMDGTGRGESQGENQKMRRSDDPTKIGVCLVCVCLLLFFDIDGIEGICGRFGRFDDERLHIGSLGLWSDDVSVSFTVLRCYRSRTMMHVRQRLSHFLDWGWFRCAEVRRQGYAFGHFNLRV